MSSNNRQSVQPSTDRQEAQRIRTMNLMRLMDGVSIEFDDATGAVHMSRPPPKAAPTTATTLSAAFSTGTSAVPKAEPEPVVDLKDYVFPEPDNAIMTPMKTDDVDALMAMPHWAARVTRLHNKPHFADVLYEFIDENWHKCLSAILEHCGDIPLEGKGSPDAPYGTTPLLYAMAKGNATIARIFLQHAEKRNINLHPICRPDRDDNTAYGPVCQTVCFGKSKILRILLKHPAFDINEKGTFGGVEMTPLLKALHPVMIAPERRMKMIKILVSDDRLDMNMADSNGETPLHYAVALGNIEVIRLLLVDKTDFAIKNRHGKTALQMAQKTNKRVIQDFIKEKERRKKEKLTADLFTKKNKTVDKDEDVPAPLTVENDQLDTSTTDKFTMQIAEKADASATVTEAASIIDRSEITPSTLSTADTLRDTTNLAPTKTLHECRMCLTKDIANILLLPCNHLALCQGCTVKARTNKQFNCPACKQRVRQYLRIRF